MRVTSSCKGWHGLNAIVLKLLKQISDSKNLPPPQEEKKKGDYQTALADVCENV